MTVLKANFELFKSFYIFSSCLICYFDFLVTTLITAVLLPQIIVVGMIINAVGIIKVARLAEPTTTPIEAAAIEIMVVMFEIRSYLLSLAFKDISADSRLLICF